MVTDALFYYTVSLGYKIRLFFFISIFLLSKVWDIEKKILFSGKKTEEYKLVKYADRLAAYLKCVEEVKAGNSEFASAKKSTIEHISALENPAAKIFVDEFIEAYNLDLDELQQKN